MSESRKSRAPSHTLRTPCAHLAHTCDTRLSARRLPEPSPPILLPEPTSPSPLSRFYSLTPRATFGGDRPVIPLRDLSTPLRVRLLKYMHRDVLEQMPIFRQIAEGAAVLLVRNMKPLTSSPGDHIVDEGTVGNEMYFLTHGKVEVLHQGSRSEGEPRAKVCELAPGDYFGEIALLDTSLPGVPTNRRLATVRSMEFCELRSVEKDDLAECFEDFPEMLETMMGLVRARISELADLNAAGSDRKESPAGDSSFGRSPGGGAAPQIGGREAGDGGEASQGEPHAGAWDGQNLRAMSHHGRGHLALAVVGMSRAGSPEKDQSRAGPHDLRNGRERHARRRRPHDGGDDVSGAPPSPEDEEQQQQKQRQRESLDYVSGCRLSAEVDPALQGRLTTCLVHPISEVTPRAGERYDQGAGCGAA